MCLWSDNSATVVTGAQGGSLLSQLGRLSSVKKIRQAHDGMLVVLLG